MSLTNEERNLIAARELARAKEAYDDILYLQKDGRLSAAAIDYIMQYSMLLVHC